MLKEEAAHAGIFRPPLIAFLAQSSDTIAMRFYIPKAIPISLSEEAE
jgi:hypothetical protein